MKLIYSGNAAQYNRHHEIHIDLPVCGSSAPAKPRRQPNGSKEAATNAGTQPDPPRHSVAHGLTPMRWIRHTGFAGPPRPKANYEFRWATTSNRAPGVQLGSSPLPCRGHGGGSCRVVPAQLLTVV